MRSAQRRELCRELFKKFHLLSVASECLLAIIIFIIGNLCVRKTQVHAVNIKHKHGIHRPVANLTVCQTIQLCKLPLKIKFLFSNSK